MRNDSLVSQRELPVDDASLARRIEAGDQASFELLMCRNNRMLYRVACSVLRNDTEAEDVLEVFLKAYRAIGQFRGESALSTWALAHGDQRLFGATAQER